MRRHEKKKCITVKPQAGEAISKNISQEEGNKLDQRNQQVKLQTKICSQKGKVRKGPFTNTRYTKPAREFTGLTYNQAMKELFQ